MPRWNGQSARFLAASIVSCIGVSHALGQAPVLERPAIDPQAREILQAANDTNASIATASYRFELKRPSQAPAHELEVITGKCWVRKVPGSRFPFGGSIRVEINPAGSGARSDGTAEGVLIFDGRKVSVIDPSAGTVSRGGPGTTAWALLEADLFDTWAAMLHPRPFGDELVGRRAEVVGAESVGGVPCDVVDVQYRRGPSARWHFGQRTSFPHRVRRNEEKREVTLTDVRTGVELPEDTFDATVPEGFVLMDLDAVDNIYAFMIESARSPATFDQYLDGHRHLIDESLRRQVALAWLIHGEELRREYERCNAHVDPQMRQRCISESPGAGLFMWLSSFQQVLENPATPWLATDCGSYTNLGKQLMEQMCPGAWGKIVDISDRHLGPYNRIAIAGGPILWPAGSIAQYQADMAEVLRPCY
jgi:outer membrane lipoprotein-sorting protein